MYFLWGIDRHIIAIPLFFVNAFFPKKLARRRIPWGARSVPVRKAFLAASTAFCDAYPVAIITDRATSAKGRNGTADMSTECHQQGIVIQPVFMGKLFPQRKFCLLRSA